MTPDSSKKGQETREKYEIQLVNLYEEYFDKIARYAFAHIGDRTEAEDIAGEVFLRALKSLDSFRDFGIPLQSWLFKIAHNMVVDYLRKKSRYLMVRND
ncbi:MAG: RNA polymerase sigma factor, partial [Dehalococcoidales bacterium]|jgi:RNA polymerase sigma-70 factor (ECF subfamily)|nr:RNA polymerase sigma factor [Dehalococcoidales bacterium]